MTETNVILAKAVKNDNIWRQIRGRIEGISWSVSYNVKYENKELQYGGVLKVVRNKLAHIGVKHNRDKWGLVKWSLTSYRGASDVPFIVVAVYVPNKASKIYEGSVWAINKATDNSPLCPCKLLTRDFKEQIVRWKEEGNQNIAVMGDWNISVILAEFIEW